MPTCGLVMPFYLPCPLVAALVLLKELASGPYSRFRSLAGPNLTKGLTALLRGALLFKVG